MTSALPRIVSRDEWDKARADLLRQEKGLTHLRDAVSAARRRMPMVEITTSYTFASEDGPVTLLDLFDGKRQLIVQHFMFHPDWDEGCEGCSMMADHIGPLQHLRQRDTNLVLISRAPLDKLLAFRERMGWSLPWVSSFGTSFNEDFHTTVNDEEHHAVSAFLRDGDRVFHTWQQTDRGIEEMISTLWLLDTTPYGRQEQWEDSPEGWPKREPDFWWQLHDTYDNP